MTIEQFGLEVLDRMPVEPTDQQIKLVAALSRFCSAMTLHDSVFVLNGYAGTGMSSLGAAVFGALVGVGVMEVLVGPMGGASNVLGHYCGE